MEGSDGIGDFFGAGASLGGEPEGEEGLFSNYGLGPLPSNLTPEKRTSQGGDRKSSGNQPSPVQPFFTYPSTGPMQMPPQFSGQESMPAAVKMETSSNNDIPPPPVGISAPSIQAHGTTSTDQCSPETLKARRKQRKNDREKKRRLEINEKFERLARMLGMTDIANSEKYNVLAEAVTVINDLRSRNSELRNEKSELRCELVNLTRALQSIFPSQPQASQNSENESNPRIHNSDRVQNQANTDDRQQERQGSPQLGERGDLQQEQTSFNEKGVERNNRPSFSDDNFFFDFPTDSGNVGAPSSGPSASTGSPSTNIEDLFTFR